MTKVEVEWYGEHVDLSPTVLNSSEGLKTPLNPHPEFSGYEYRVPATMVILQGKVELGLNGLRSSLCACRDGVVYQESWDFHEICRFNTRGI